MKEGTLGAVRKYIECMSGTKFDKNHPLASELEALFHRFAMDFAHRVKWFTQEHNVVLDDSGVALAKIPNWAKSVELMKQPDGSVALTFLVKEKGGDAL